MKTTDATTNTISRQYSALMERALDLAICEDLGIEPKDITTDALVPENAEVTARLYCKQKGVIAGLDVAAMVFQRFDRNLNFRCLVENGSAIDSVPVAIADISGLANPLLKSERLALNLVQRMSGIATITRAFVEKAKPFGIEILDTRKTTPGLRTFERIAVKLAGGTNHRFGLFDALLIKDNHIRVAGGITSAVEKARSVANGAVVEVETTTLEEVQEAVEARADRIMLDNMTPNMVRDAVALVCGKAYIEVSGGVNLSNIDNYLIAGVNGISVGALTHSAPSLDISLEVEKIQ